MRSYARTSIAPNETDCFLFLVQQQSPFSCSALDANEEKLELLRLRWKDDRQLLRGSPSSPKGVGPAYALLMLDIEQMECSSCDELRRLIILEIMVLLLRFCEL
mmetsp:Transcript_10939/g.16116  ORF Transcript_10939/g.16116 Transcript_10939/m.16116 type:complete len:104 (+) Transcript_10939:206-517(+)